MLFLSYSSHARRICVVHSRHWVKVDANHETAKWNRPLAGNTQLYPAAEERTIYFHGT
jgi:hypothetical protein